MLAVVVAWISRSLPSAFNEKVQVFHAAAISILLAFMTILLISITSDPTTHPDVKVCSLFHRNEFVRLSFFSSIIFLGAAGLSPITFVDQRCSLCLVPHCMAKGTACS